MPSTDTQFKKGNKLGKKFQKGQVHVFTDEWKKNISKARKGKNRKFGSENPAWKGGVTNLYDAIRNLFEYRQWRSDVFTRDKFICQECGYEKGRCLEAHHKVTLKDLIMTNNIKTPEEAIKCEKLWDINNGMTLCQSCHTKIHNNKLQ